MPLMTRTTGSPAPTGNSRLLTHCRCYHACAPHPAHLGGPGLVRVMKPGGSLPVLDSAAGTARPGVSIVRATKRGRRWA